MYCLAVAVEKAELQRDLQNCLDRCIYRSDLFVVHFSDASDLREQRWGGALLTSFSSIRTSI